MEILRSRANCRAWKRMRKNCLLGPWQVAELKNEYIGYDWFNLLSLSTTCHKLPNRKRLIWARWGCFSGFRTTLFARLILFFVNWVKKRNRPFEPSCFCSIPKFCSSFQLKGLSSKKKKLIPQKQLFPLKVIKTPNHPLYYDYIYICIMLRIKDKIWKKNIRPIKFSNHQPSWYILVHGGGDSFCRDDGLLLFTRGWLIPR